MHRSLSLSQRGELPHHFEVFHTVGFGRYALVIGHIEHDVKCIGECRGYKAYENYAHLADRNCLILVVEDEFLIRAMLSDYLQDCGFKVLEASSADEP